MVGRPADVVTKGSGRRAALVILALLLLLVAVGIASTGSVPVGSGGTRRPADKFLDVGLSLYLLLMIPAAALWVYILTIRRDVVAESLIEVRRRRKWVSRAAYIVGFGVLALLVRWISVDGALRRRLSGGLGGSPGNASGDKLANPGGYEPQFATGPVLVVVALIALAVVAWYLSDRARRQADRADVGCAASRARRRPRRDPRRPEGGNRPQAGGDRSVCPDGARSRRLWASPQPGGGPGRIPAAHLHGSRGQPSRHLSLD